MTTFAFSAASSRISATTILQIVQRWQHGSDPLHLRQFSAASRASRRHKMSIQRLALVFPPAISADVLHKLP